MYQANNTPQAMENPPEGSGVELRARQLERAQLMKAWMWSGLTFIGAYASGAASFYFFSLTDSGLFGVGSERSARLIGLGFGLLAVLLFVLAFVIAVMRRIRIIERRDERVREAVGDAAFDVLDARDWPDLARANSRQLSLYQQLAHRQAEYSLVIRDLFGALSQGEESPNAKPQEPQGSSNSGSIRHRLAALR